MTVTIIFNQADVQRFIDRVSPLQLTSRVAAGMNESMEYLKGEVQKAIVVDSGRGRGSVFTELRGSSISTLRGTIASPEVHVAVMETGRRPGRRPPPLGPIRLWLSRHGMDSRLAFVVARAIGRRGTFGGGLHMFSNAVSNGAGTVRTIIVRHLRTL